MKRNNTKKLAISTTTIRTLRVLSTEDAARVAGATGIFCYRNSVGCNSVGCNSVSCNSVSCA
jgi:hypothetical protein